MTPTPELIERILSRIAGGESLRAILAGEDMPGRTTFFKWLNEDEALANQYARACAVRVEHYVEEIIEIADDGLNDTYTDDNGNKMTDHDVIARSRLRVDARKWIASKLAPKKYGDKIEVEQKGEVSHKITFKE